MITQSPERNWEFIYASHPDHLATGEAAVCAVYPDARNPFAHPELLDVEGLEPWTVPELWIMGPAGTERSPSRSTPRPRSSARSRRSCATRARSSDPEGIRQRVLDWSQAGARRPGFPRGRSAELFRVTRIP